MFQAELMLFADHGLPIFSNGIVVGDAYLKAHPAVVRAFVTASDRGWAYAEQHPDAAVADERQVAQAEGLKLPPGLDQMMHLALQLTQTRQNRGHPVGWMPPQAWTQSLAILHRYGLLPKVLPAGDYYTDSFIGS